MSNDLLNVFPPALRGTSVACARYKNISTRSSC